MTENKAAVLTFKVSDAPFGLAAQIEFCFIQGVSLENMPLNIHVYFDEESFFYVAGAAEGFTLKFRRCDLVVISREGEFTKSPPKYRKTLPPEEFKALLTKSLLAHTSAAGKLSAGLSKSFEVLLSSIGLALSADGDLRGNRENKESEETKRQIKYPVVEPIGPNRWRIGHEILGDPTKIDGALSGEYFHEIPDGRTQKNYNDDVLTSLGMFAALNDQKKINIKFELRSRFQDCIFIPIGSKVIDGSKLTVEWKSKIEKLITLKALRDKQLKRGDKPRENEFIVARCSVSMERI